MAAVVIDLRGLDGQMLDDNHDLGKRPRPDPGSAPRRWPGIAHATELTTVRARLSFALCDGVGGSFLGSLAAEYLGEHLCRWMWDKGTSGRSGGAENLQRDLDAFLRDLIPAARQRVAEYPLHEVLAPLLRD